MNAPCVAALIPFHDEPDYVLQAVACSVLNQTCTNVRVVLFRDGGRPTAAIRELAKVDERVIYSECDENRGRATARNQCLKMIPSSVDWFTWLDADDLLGPTAFEEASRAFCGHTWVRLQGNFIVTLEQARRPNMAELVQETAKRQQVCDDRIQKIETASDGFTGLLHNLYIRNEAWIAATRFPDGANYAEDWAWGEFVQQKLQTRNQRGQVLRNYPPSSAHFRYIAANLRHRQNYVDEPRYYEQYKRVYRPSQLRELLEKLLRCQP